GQHIYGNTTAVSGSGILGGYDLDHANVIENNASSLFFSGPVQFNRITGTTIGVVATNGQLIAHNIIYGVTQEAVLVAGKTGVRIIGNTFDNPAADNVRI